MSIGVMLRATTYGIVKNASACRPEERLLAIVRLFLESVSKLLVAHGMWDHGKRRCIFVHVRKI